MNGELKAWRGKRRLREVADMADVTMGTWSRWESGSLLVPATRVLEIEAMTGVSRHILRPDVFGEPPKAKRARR